MHNKVFFKNSYAQDFNLHVIRFFLTQTNVRHDLERKRMKQHHTKSTLLYNALNIQAQKTMNVLAGS